MAFLSQRRTGGRGNEMVIRETAPVFAGWYHGIFHTSFVPVFLRWNFFCGAAFLAILFLVVRYLIWHDPVQGWTTLMCAMLLISGVQLLCVGILGQYLARIYLEVKNRPVYLLKETDEEETENEG